MIFIDYNGIIDPKTGVKHVGHRAISGRPKNSVVVLLSPGVQALDTEVWEAVRHDKGIGWDGKECVGHLVVTGQIKVLPGKSGKVVDWKTVMLADLVGETGIIGRTIHPVILESLRRYAISRAEEQPTSWSPVVAAVTKQLDDVLTGFDDKKVDVATAQSRFPQVIGA